MSDVCLIADLKAVAGCDAFCEASKEELRTLIAISSESGVPTSYERISELAGVSLARAKSAVALWEELGVIRSAGDFAELVDEFEIKEETKSSVSVAKSLRDENIKELIDECAVLLERPDGLSSEEIKTISALCTEKRLSSEYIAGLAAYMAEAHTAKGKKLTVKALSREAEKLADKGIDTLEELEIYIINKEAQTRDEWEYRRVIGLFGRSPSDSEREVFKRWSEEYGYSTPIIKAAYNIACMNISVNSNPVTYMDKVITAWYGAGYRTVEECIADHNRGKHNNKLVQEDKKTNGKRSAEADKPKFSDFDSEDALKRALERSYGSSEDN